MSVCKSVRTYARMCIYVCMHYMCVCMSIYKCIYLSISIYIYIYVSVDAGAYVSVYTYAYTYTYQKRIGTER